jgi:hypothetical protein
MHGYAGRHEPLVSPGSISWSCHRRAAIRSCVSTVSLPMSPAGSPGAHDHCVPIAPPSAETETTAMERSFPSRANARCSCKMSMIDAIDLSAGASIGTSRGILRTSAHRTVPWFLFMMLPLLSVVCCRNWIVVVTTLIEHGTRDRALVANSRQLGRRRED